MPTPFLSRTTMPASSLAIGLEAHLHLAAAPGVYFTALVSRLNEDLLEAHRGSAMTYVGLSGQATPAASGRPCRRAPTHRVDGARHQRCDAEALPLAQLDLATRDARPHRGIFVDEPGQVVGLALDDPPP